MTDSISNNSKCDGLYVKVSIHDKEYRFLVDTGASDSYISRQVFENIPENQRPVLQEPNKNAKLADNSPLPLHGIVTLELKIGPTCGFSKLLVADISNDGIIGLDNLCKMEAKIDLANFRLCTK